MEYTFKLKEEIVDKLDVFKYLSIRAADKGTNLKNYIESLLIKEVENMNDSETYKYLCKTRPEGHVLLNEEETNEFIDWLGVVAK